MTLHNALTGAELHEPKAIAAAAKGTVYVADGAGSGAFSTPTGNNTVVVNALADLPTPSGGTITLVADTNYIFAAAITTSDFFTVAQGVNITANNALSPLLTYSGTGSMFVGADVDFTINDMLVTCPTAQIFDISESAAGGTKIFIVKDVVCIACTSYGTFDKMRSVLIDFCSSLTTTTGVTVTGNVTQIFSVNKLAMLGTSTTMIGIDITGTATIDSIEIGDLIVAGGAGSIAIKGDAASANVTTGFIATVRDGSFDGVTTPLSGITIDDIRWSFRDNGSLADTMPDALVSMVSNATVTTLSVGVPTLVAGTWTLERASQFTTTTAGRATYNGERNLVTPIDVSVVIDPASGTNKSFRAFVALNGVAVASSGIAVNISAGDPKQISVPWQANLSTTDFVEVFIENETDSVNATVIDATVRVR